MMTLPEIKLLPDTKRAIKGVANQSDNISFRRLRRELLLKLERKDEDTIDTKKIIQLSIDISINDMEFHNILHAIQKVFLHNCGDVVCLIETKYAIPKTTYLCDTYCCVNEYLHTGVSGVNKRKWEVYILFFESLIVVYINFIPDIFNTIIDYICPNNFQCQIIFNKFVSYTINKFKRDDGTQGMNTKMKKFIINTLRSTKARKKHGKPNELKKWSKMMSKFIG